MDAKVASAADGSRAARRARGKPLRARAEAASGGEARRRGARARLKIRRRTRMILARAFDALERCRRMECWRISARRSAALEDVFVRRVQVKGCK